MKNQVTSSFFTAFAVAALVFSGFAMVEGAVARFPVPIAVCGGTCGGSNAQLTGVPGVTACASADTGYTCTNIGNSVHDCSACIHNTAAPGKCRCLLT